jgi:hypothetical protein
LKIRDTAGCNPALRPKNFALRPCCAFTKWFYRSQDWSHAEFGHKSVYTNDRWGTPELVLSARTLGLSIAQPRLSPDGRWLFFCGTAYGCWPTYDPDSNLYAIDLRTGGNGAEFAWRKLEINSPECESWLSWSSNSRWVVFSSKRMSPLFSRPHLAYVGADGRCGKPFVLPQRDPTFYDSQLLTYTIPTLATGPVPVSQAALVRAIKSGHHRDLQLP